MANIKTVMIFKLTTEELKDIIKEHISSNMGKLFPESEKEFKIIEMIFLNSDEIGHWTLKPEDEILINLEKNGI